jgi:hypothetical protein
MPDLAQVVEPAVFFQHGIAHGAAIDTSVGANFTIIANYHRADLRHFFPVVGGKGNPKTIGPDDRTWMDHHPFSQPHVIADTNVGVQVTALAEPGIRFQHCTRPDGAAVANVAIIANYDVGSDTHVFAD